MAHTAPVPGVRFGRTIVVATAGDLLEQSVDAVVYGANCRGLMGRGGPGAIRLVAGPDVETEAMRRAPLALGAAVVTGSGALAGRGIRAIVHAVVHPVLGEPVKLPVVRRATAATLAAAEADRLRSLAMPILGAGTSDVRCDVVTLAEAMVDEIVGHLRRSSSRLERIVLVTRLAVDEAAVAEAVARARERSWVRPL